MKAVRGAANINTYSSSKMASDPEARERMRRLAIIGVSSFLLVAMAVAVTVGVSLNQSEESESSDSPKDGNKSHVSDSMKAVTSICRPTDYKKECVSSLTSEAGNSTDPKELIKKVFNITIRSVGESLQKTHVIQELEKDPKSKMALDTCMNLMGLSIGEFRRSVENMGSFDLAGVDTMLMNLKVWISGAITYQQTCLDGFQNITTPAGEKMEQILNVTMERSSNLLAIITDFANSLAELNIAGGGGRRRRLFQDVTVKSPVLGHGDDSSDNVDVDVDVDLLFGDGAHGRRLLATGVLKPNVIVAQDGSGKVKTINEALKLVPRNNLKPFIIYVKEGVYKEFVHVMKNMSHVVMIGDGASKTKISGNLSFGDGVIPYNTASAAIEGDFFVGIKIGFENTADAGKREAVALRVQGDMAVFYKCSIDGNQDTLYAHAMRQFYRDCTISGSLDFVIGDAIAVFQNCTFVVKQPKSDSEDVICTVTAQGRKERHEPTGFVLQGGSIVADPHLEQSTSVYLARPWKTYSRTIFMNMHMGGFIRSAGFRPWLGTYGTDTCYYAEFNNDGPGSNKSKRVKWGGVKNITETDAESYTPVKFFNGDKWIRITQIPYTPGSWSSNSTTSTKSKSS